MKIRRKSSTMLFTIFMIVSILALTLSPFEAKPTEAAGNGFWHTSASSPFNQPLSANAVYVPETRIGTFRQTYEEWSTPIVRVADTTGVPLVTVINDYSGRTVRWPIPQSAVPASAADHALSVVDVRNRISYEFWNARWDGPTTIRAGGMKDFPLDGNGISNPPHYRVSAAGFAITAGMLTREDFLVPGTNTLDPNRTITHALTFNVPAAITQDNGYVAPAVGGEDAGQAGADGIPMGARFALPRNVNLSTLNVHPLTRAYLQAARDYGLYVKDCNSAPNYNGKYSASMDLEPGLTEAMFGVNSDTLISRVQSEVYNVIQQYGFFRVYDNGSTPPSPTPTSPTPTTPPPPQTGNVGDFVWNDVNINGRQDTGEAGMSGVTIALYRSNNSLVSSTTSDGSGRFQFTQVPTGDYYLKFTAPPRYEFTLVDVNNNGNESSDSDANRTTGQTTTFNVAAGATVSNRDAGFAQAGVTVNPTQIQVTEGGAGVSYTVVLKAPPVGTVTMSITAAGNQITLNKNSLSFTASNWSTAQSVTVTAVNDTVVEDPQTIFVTHSFTTFDAAYNGMVVPSVTVSVIDNDTAPGPNSPPLVSASQATVSVNEGQNASNTGTVSDPNNNPVVMSASVGTVTNNNGAWSWSFTTSDGPVQTQTVTIYANDGLGGIGQATFALNVSNVAPTGTFVANPANTTPGGTVTLAFSNGQDPSSNDVTAGYKYAYDCLNDGLFDVTDSTSTSYACTYPDTGSFTARGRIQDKDGGFTDYTATINVNSSSDVVVALQNFVLLGQEGIWMQENSVVNSGDVAAANASAGPYLRSNSEVALDDGAKLLNSSSRLFGDSLRLKSGTQAYNVYYNDINSQGQILGSQFTPLTLPVVAINIPVPSFSTGKNDVQVWGSSPRTLNAGSYDDLEVGRNGVVNFTGGVYNFEDWTVDSQARLNFLAPTEIRISGRLRISDHSYVGPAPSSNLGAESIVFFVLGRNSSANNPTSTPSTVKFDDDSVIIANVYAPNGTLHIDNRTQATGAFVARWVILGARAQVSHNSVWGQPVNFASFASALPEGELNTASVVVEETAPQVSDEVAWATPAPEAPGPVVLPSYPVPAECAAITFDGAPIVGTEDADQLAGTEGNDLIFGLGGNDQIFAQGGNDCIVGAAGDDIVYGGAGDDVILGNEGNDTLYSEDGNDFVLGDTGLDSIYGGAGNDNLSGGRDNDTVYGEDGDDIINGNEEDDALLVGGLGNDTIYGGEGHDKLYGDEVDLGDTYPVSFGNEPEKVPANDMLYGENGNDEIYGGPGNDLLDGGNDQDLLFGGMGSDLLSGGAHLDAFNGGADSDQVLDYDKTLETSCQNVEQGCDPDTDLDGIVDTLDNCPAVANADQADADADGIGNACDPTPNGDVPPPPPDSDGDGLPDGADNCAAVPNPDQGDADADGIGNACDPTPNGDVPQAPADSDGDGFADTSDNCPAVPNPDQLDGDSDGAGDVCDAPPSW